jgi:hypothetical protein
MDRPNRHKSHTLIRAVLALFVTVWLNMALQPCLMAAELAMPDEHSSGDCVHCPQTGDVIDDDNCAYVDGYDFDGRLPSLDFDHHTAVVVSTIQWDELLPVSARQLPAWTVAARGPPTRPPLNVLHCVYLK